MNYLKENPKGQSAVEFVLIAPLVFFIFFGIIQLSYMAYVSLAVQRAALAVARDASLSQQDNSTAFKTQLTVALLPIATFNQKTLSTILASEYNITFSPDGQEVVAHVHYPMPIWVPLIKNILGRELGPSPNYNQTPEGGAIKAVFQILGKPAPDLSFQEGHLSVIWIDYRASTFYEGYGP